MLDAVVEPKLCTRTVGILHDDFVTRSPNEDDPERHFHFWGMLWLDDVDVHHVADFITMNSGRFQVADQMSQTTWCLKILFTGPADLDSVPNTAVPRRFAIRNAGAFRPIRAALDDVEAAFPEAHVSLVVSLLPLLLVDVGDWRYREAAARRASAPDNESS